MLFIYFLDKITRKVKGFAFVTYVMPENAVKAYSQLDGTTFQGRLLHLIPGKAKLSDEELAEKEGIAIESGTSSFKKQKSAKDKAKAESTHNWNSLFLGSSAVADLMADRYGVRYFLLLILSNQDLVFHFMEVSYSVL